MFSMTARAKHDAWVNQAKLYSSDLSSAKERYISIARDIGWDGDVSASSSSGPMGGVKVSTMAPLEVDRDTGAGSGSSKLHDAVIDGDERVVRTLIEDERVPVDSRDEYVSSVLDILASRVSEADEVGLDITSYSR